MILYATKQTIKDSNIPMVNELSQFNRVLAQKVIEEQTNDRLLEWGLKIFYFDNRKCVQAVNYASKLTIFLFDIKEAEIVKYIFNRYAQGVGSSVIAKELTNMKYKTPKGLTVWSDSTVRKNLLK